MNMHESNYDANNDIIKILMGELLNVEVVVHYDREKQKNRIIEKKNFFVFLLRMKYSFFC